MSSKDVAQMTDGLAVGIVVDAVKPVAPCQACGAETKPHHPVLDDGGGILQNRRICSNRDCRVVVASPLM